VSRDLRQLVEERHGEEDDRGELLEVIRLGGFEVVGAFTMDTIPQHIRTEMRTAGEVVEPPEDDAERLTAVGSTHPNVEPEPDQLEDELVGAFADR
jgi:hypothetical protein